MAWLQALPGVSLGELKIGLPRTGGPTNGQISPLASGIYREGQGTLIGSAALPPVLYRPVLSKNLSLYVAGVCPVPPVAGTVFCCDWVVETFTCGFERVNCSLQHAWLAEIVKVAPNATARNDAASSIDFLDMSAAPQVRDL